jgi:tRNA threonylcarbamoyladenosine biosynthesis protein TsaB
VLVLALDTTTRSGSCAVARDGVVLLEQAADVARSHDAQLPAALMTLLEGARISLSEIDVFAVATGPGSFTGLRVGIATMQGLAFAAAKPLIGVSAFEALVRRTDGGLVATWIDAWRGEVYAALYDNAREVEAPSVEHPGAILTRLAASGAAREYTFIGEGSGIYKDMIVAAMRNHARVAEPVAPLLAGTMALLATDTARAGHLPPPHAIRPLYVRRPDALLARNARPVH